MLADRSLDLEARWGTEHRTRGNDVLRFFAKHVCCRIAELTTSEQSTFIPPDIVSFLGGGRPPASLRYELSIEPVQLRMEALWSGHPLAARAFFFDDLWTTGRGAYGSGWRYGWLTFRWWLTPGADETPETHPLAAPTLPLPLVATQFDVGFELAMALGLYHAEEHEPAPANERRPTATEGSASTDGASADASPPPNQVYGLYVTQYFLAGLLDVGSGLDGRALDERRNTHVGASGDADLEAEVMRAAQLVACTALWATGNFDSDAALAAASSAPRSPGEARALAASAEAAATAADATGALPHHFASTSGLRFAEAHLAGIETERGKELLLDAAHHAGACLAAAAHATDQRAAAYTVALIDLTEPA